MSSSANPSDWLQEAFSPTSLSALNAKAAMLNRIDNKYIVTSEILQQAMPDLAQLFDILEIDGKRGFVYETSYFDDPALHCYCDHHQGRRKRVKVRTRRYCDAGLCFLEVKLKDKRGSTVKSRLAYDVEKHGSLDEGAWTYLRDVYRAQYGVEFGHSISRVLDMRYARMTLVAKEGGERMTIDNGLRFFSTDTARPVDNRVFIIETKSANGNGTADRILRTLHRHPVKHCSKYCAGIAALVAGIKRNNFQPMLRQLGLV